MADQKKVETGREMLAAYRKKKKSPSQKQKGPKSPEKVPKTSGGTASNDSATCEGESSGSTICPNESLNSSNERGDIQRLSTRIKELEEIVAGKDAALAAQREELDMSKDISVDISSGMLSFGLESDYRACLEKYQQRLEEFESAVNHRDDLIRQLSEGLRLAKLSHEAKEEQLAQGIELLQRQLHAATQLVQGHSWDTGINPHDYLLLKNQMLTLEDNVGKNKTVINELNAALKLKDETLGAKAEELSALKVKAAGEVQELMREIEELNQRSQSTINSMTLDETLLRAQIEENFGLQLTQIKEELRNQLALEYATELSSLKQRIEELTTTCQNAASVEDKLTSELASYEVELTLHKEQMANLKQKLVLLASEAEASQLSQESELMSYKQQVESLNARHKDATILKTQVESLKNNLLLLEESHLKELEQCRQNHTKEVDMLNQQNETLEIELDRLQTEEAKYTAELNACKEAFIAQFGIPKLTNETEVTSLRQQVNALNVQLKDATATKEKSASDLDAKRDVLEREVKDLHDVKVSSLSEHVQQLLASQESLVRENALYVTQLAQYKDLLQERSSMEASNVQDVVELQEELSSYKQQIEMVEERHSKSISTLNKTHEEQVQHLNAQLKHISSVSSEEIDFLKKQIHSLEMSLEEIVMNKDNVTQELDACHRDHNATVISYENKLKEMNEELSKLNLKHSETVSSTNAKLQAALTSVQEKTQFAEECQHELQLCKDQLLKLNAQHGIELQGTLERYGRDMQESLEKYGRDFIAERDQLADVYKTDLIEIHQQIRDMTKNLSKESRFEQIATTNLDSNILSLSPGLRQEINVLQDLIKHREENFGNVKSQLLETMAVLQGTQALLVGKEELEQSLHERELLLHEANESFSAAKEAESALEMRVRELEAELDRRSKEFMVIKEKLQELSVAKPRVDLQSEADNRIQELEITVSETRKDSQSMKDTLRDTVAKLLAAQALVDAKEEVETSLQSRVSELMSSLQAVNVDSQEMRAESDGLALKVAKAKELLKRLKAERDNLMQLNKEHYEEINSLKGKLSLSDSSVQELTDQVEELKKRLDSSEKGASQTQSDNLEPLTLQAEITQLQNQQQDLVSKCDRYEEEVRLLQSQLSSTESTLEGLRQELANNKSAQDVPCELRSVEGRESILASGDQVAIAGLSFLGGSFYNDNNSSGFLNNMTEYMDVASFKASNGMNLIESCNQLENERDELEQTVQRLKDKLKEKELSEGLCKQEITTSMLRYKDLEARLAAMTNNLEQVEIDIAEKMDLENKVAMLEGELKTLQDIQGNLQNELLNKQVAYEEKFHNIVKEQLSESMLIAKSDSVEDVIRELGGKAKEVIVLAEKLRNKEQMETALNTRVEMLEECRERYVNQLAVFKEEASRSRMELQESWQNHRHSQDELGQAKRELALLQLTNEQLENSLARLRDANSGSSSAIAKMSVLKEILEQQVVPRPTMAATVSPSNTTMDDSLVDASVGDLRCKLEDIFRRDTSHARSPTKPDGNKAALVAELAFYREQHAALAGVLGSAGALQDALHKQKHEERSAMDTQLDAERARSSQLQLRLLVLEQQVLEKDGQCVELVRQRQQMERELATLEERLREREEVVEGARADTEAELREKELRIRQWQVQCRARELELSHSQAMSHLPPPSTSPASPTADRLDRLRVDMDVAHDRAVSRLKMHLQEVFSLQESETRVDHAQQLAAVEQQHLMQLANTQQQIQAKIHELDTFQRSIDQRETHESDLEEIRLRLDENQKEIYSVLRQEFDSFARQQISAAVEKLKAQHEVVLVSQTAFHSQELQALQTKLEEQKQKEILSIKRELLQRHEKDLRDAREASESELTRISRSPRTYPTDSRAAVQLLKQFLCNEFTSSFRALTDARYGSYCKQLSALSLQLETALDQEQTPKLDNAEVLISTQETLVEETQALLQTVVLEHSRMLETLGEHLDVGHTQLLKYLEHTAHDVDKAVTAATLREQVGQLEHDNEDMSKQHKLSVDELTKDRDDTAAKLDQLKAVVGVECGPCIFLRQELEAKHTKEMEELRRYFEQKCADVEKNYSEEIFSQHSRKLSSSSSSCDNELVSDICYGDHARGNTHVCDTQDQAYKDLEGQCRRECDKRVAECHDELEIVKRDTEEKYRVEMEVLKDDYEAKVEELVRDLTSSHQVDITDMEAKHCKELENMREKLRSETEQVQDELEATHARQLGELKISFEQRLSSDVEALTDRMLRDEAAHIALVKAELVEQHAREVELLEAKMAEQVEAKQYSDQRSQQLFELEQKHKRDTMTQLQALLAEKGEGKFGEDYRRQLEELDERHRVERECERKVMEEQMEQFTGMLKLGAEQEQEKFMKVQKEIMSGFLLQHKQDVKLLTEQYEAQLNMAQEEIQKLLTERAEYDDIIVQGKRRLHAEVQQDVVKALDEQLQLLLTEGGDTSSCPPELLQLQDKFSARYKLELVALKAELAELRQARQVPTTLVYDSVEDDSRQATIADREQAFNKEKARQLAKTMKSLVCELTKYVSVCEDELNNTLVDQLLKYETESCLDDEQEPSLFRDAADVSASLTNGDIPYLSIISNLDNSDLGSKSLSNDNTLNKSCVSDIQLDVMPVDTPGGKSGRKRRRVHFAPDISNIVDMDEEGLMEYVEKNSEGGTSVIRVELDKCLERLRADARALMGVASAVPKHVAADEQHSELQRQLATEVSARVQLSARLEEFQAYKTECERLAELIEKLGSELCVARMRISELESREDVTEGYGEQGQSKLTSRIQNLADLQDQARGILNEGTVSAAHAHLIEELCREGDRLVEEAQHEKEDLQLQVSVETPSSVVHRVCCAKVEAADKQLRSTRQFLEEQAAEREQERDDFLQEISRLAEQLKVTENHKVDGQQLAKEVETLEVQVKEATSLLKEADTRKEELEVDLKAAVAKVWVLRDIISELESQVELKSRNEASLEEQLHDLQELLEQQAQSNQELNNQLDSGKSDMAEHIKELEEQLRLHQQQIEQFQPDSIAVKEMTTTLREFETTLEKKTKELEAVYITSTSTSSSPSVSEEVSIREQIDDMRSATPDDNSSFSLLPLNQLRRLNDKLDVHSRAEQAALKKIRDLEMQIKALRYDEEEVTAERDVLQTQVEEQLLKISLLHSNVEEQRSKADNMIQAASADLQKRLHDREIETRDLKKALENKEKQVKAVSVLLEQTRQAVAAQEAEWTDRVKKEQEVVHKLKKEYKKLKDGKSKKAKETEVQTSEAGSSLGRYVPVPSLLDAVQANCHAEMANLQRQIEAYRCLKLTPEQTTMLQQLLKQLNASQAACNPQSCEGNATTTLFEHGSEASRDNDDAFSSEAESEVDDGDLRNKLLRKEATIKSLRHKLADRMSQSLSSLHIEMENKDKRISQLEEQLSELPHLHAEMKRLQEEIGNTPAGVSQDKDHSRLEKDINSLEEELKQERQLTKSLKDELNQLRAELKSLKLSGTVDACPALRSVTRNRPASPTCGISPDVYAILRKILEFGFEALTLEELTNVHEPICTATGRMLDANPELRPVDASLLAVSSHQLCGRIYQLEKEIMRKEQASQKKVCSLESSVDYEKQRLQDLKKALAERERNNRELSSKLGNQLQLQGDLVAERDMLRNEALHYENRASAAAQQLEREKSKVLKLEDELNKERNNNQHFQSQLEAERIRATNSNMKQSDLLESMRIHLEASRDKESRLRFELDRLMSIQQHGVEPSTSASVCVAACNTSLSHPERYAATEAEDDLVVRLQLELRREQRSVEQIQTLLDSEKQHSTQRIEREREKSKKLRKLLSATEDEKENVIIQLDTAREALSSQQLVVESLERKLVDWQGAEQRRHKRWADEEDRNRKSLEKALCAKFELEQKILDMEQEMMEIRERASASGDHVTVGQLQKQLAESCQREQRLIEQTSAAPRENKISTSLLQKLQGMNSILESHVAEHTEIVNRLTLERQQLREKVKTLEARDAQNPAGRKFDENETEIVSGILSAERATWSREKAALLSSLAQAEAIRRHHDNNNADADRVRHLFGKYLRVESYRKALVWQKRYLMIVINGYQDFESKTLSQLTHIAKTQRSIKVPDAVPSTSNRGTLNKFRSCGMAIIAIHRMKFLVRRWRHSRSIGSTAVFIHGSTESIASAQSSYYGSRRHVPSYWSVPRGIPSSLSPTREHHGSAGPTSLNKDSHMLKRWQQEPQYRSSDAITGLEPLQMTEYMSRFDQLQQRLGLAVAHPPS